MFYLRSFTSTMFVLLLCVTSANAQMLFAEHSWVTGNDYTVMIEAQIDLAQNEATLAMTGPINDWFAYGFGASSMNGTYAITVEDVNGTIVLERRLGNHNIGTILDASITSQSEVTNVDEKTVTIVLPAVTGDGRYDFPQKDSIISFISATGYGGSVQYHGPSNHAEGLRNTMFGLQFTTVVPVTWSGFSIRYKGNGVDLHWKTESETNNKGFYIQRSNDGRSWESVGYLDGIGEKGGNYFYRDVNYLPGINYYRLKQVDYNGDENYSVVKSIEIRGKEKFDDIVIYPNPVKDKLSISSKAVDKNKRIQIIDMNSKVWFDETWPKNHQSHLLDVSNLPSGHYFINVMQKEWHYADHFVKH